LERGVSGTSGFLLVNIIYIEVCKARTYGEVDLIIRSTSRIIDDSPRNYVHLLRVHNFLSFINYRTKILVLKQ
jgi:hypothetical protein